MGTKIKKNKLIIMNKLPILLLDNIFLFPKCDIRLNLKNNIYWKKIIFRTLKDYQGKLLIIPNKEKISNNLESFPSIGTLAKISLNISSENSSEIVINSLEEVKFSGLERIKVINLKKIDDIWEAEYQVMIDKEMDEIILDELIKKFVRFLPEILEKSKLSSIEKFPYMTMMRGNIATLIDFITQNSREIDLITKWKILASLNVGERLEILITIPDRRRIEEDLDRKTKEEITNQQEEYYLREKLKAIEKRLKDKNTHSSGSEVEEILRKLDKEPYPDYVKKVVQEEIKRYQSMPNNSSEASIIKQYIDILVNLPWWQKTKEIKDLKFARQKLDEKHFGLKEPKERVIEYLAAQQKTEKPLNQVICFVGPPGIGKTSLAASIAEATGRKFVNISLAGVRDVAEIQGHRRTYIGAMPGRIIQSIKTVNQLILIDEIDKISSDFRGDPTYALLPIFDPNQNKKFIDNYLGEKVPYDLSKVMFICSANSFDLPLPLLDRMEIIQLYSYTEIEKFQIAKEYLIPENLKKYNLNLNKEEVVFEDQAIKDIIKYYTREAGVRELSRMIQLIIRKFIVQLIQEEVKKMVITSDNLKDYLKKRKYEFTQKLKNPQPGVVTGLAYTGYGGDILPIEVVHYPRKEGELELTGNLGDIMKESAHIALNYIKANYKKFNINLEIFSKNGIHIHSPEGSTPKEGPSAGIALTSAIISSLIGEIIPRDIGMTGEITLHGHVEAIGGLKEKSIAAHRGGLKTIIIPKANEPDIDDIPSEILKDMKIILVKEYQEVWEIIFPKKIKKISIPIKPTRTKSSTRIV